MDTGSQDFTSFTCNEKVKEIFHRNMKEDLDFFNNDSWVILGQDLSLHENHKLMEKRKAFFEGNDSCLHDIEQEIISSWNRSKELGINPNLQDMGYRIKTEEINLLLKEKRNFLDVAQLNISQLFPLLDDPEYMFSVDSEDGIVLSNLEEIFPFPAIDRLNSSPGSLATEDSVGTSALPFCLKYKKIVQMIGAFHYSAAFSNHLTTVLPIFSADKKLIGEIVIVRNMIKSKTTVETQRKILNWAEVLKFTVESQLALLYENEQLCINNRSLGGGSSHFVASLEYEKDDNTGDCFSNIVGQSPAIKHTIHTAQRFSRAGSGVMITGESGTGKELFAQAIHNYSRRNRPFVAINCAAIPPNLIASELFGYVGGAFTGANRNGNIGKIEAANGGTLFLDEIGDMPMDVQLSLLRVLEDRKISKLGEYKPILVDFVFVSATNKDLKKLVEENKFREDLFYRLEILQLHLPPLRERGRDILLLAKKFVSDMCREKRRSVLPFSPETEDVLMSYSWPGNVRQLKNTMIYAVNMCPGSIIRVQDLPLKFRESDAATAEISGSDAIEKSRIPTLQQVEEEAIIRALRLTNNNVRKAAQILDTSNATMYRKIKEYGIN